MREALIVWGGWSGHEPEEGASIVRDMLTAEGFKVYVENTTEAFADPSIADMSLIVPIYTMSKIEKEELANLTKAVEGGVGLAGYHGGMCDAFREAVDYQFMTGGQWVAHPGNATASYTVRIGPISSPITAGLRDFAVTSEQSYMPVDPGVTVLAHTLVPPGPGSGDPYSPDAPAVGGPGAPSPTGAGNGYADCKCAGVYRCAG
mgnify:CR=1 FL=1